MWNVFNNPNNKSRLLDFQHLYLKDYDLVRIWCHFCTDREPPNRSIYRSQGHIRRIHYKTLIPFKRFLCDLKRRNKTLFLLQYLWELLVYMIKCETGTLISRKFWPDIAILTSKPYETSIHMHRIENVQNFVDQCNAYRWRYLACVQSVQSLIVNELWKKKKSLFHRSMWMILGSFRGWLWDP